MHQNIPFFLEDDDSNEQEEKPKRKRGRPKNSLSATIPMDPKYGKIVVIESEDKTIKQCQLLGGEHTTNAQLLTDAWNQVISIIQCDDNMSSMPKGKSIIEFFHSILMYVL